MEPSEIAEQDQDLAQLRNHTTAEAAMLAEYYTVLAETMPKTLVNKLMLIKCKMLNGAFIDPFNNQEEGW